MKRFINAAEFESITATDAYEIGQHCANISLLLGKLAMDFSCIDRVPRFANGERESDVEHSFMLALVAPELAAALELPLNQGLVTQFALVHDMIELKTGDVATFLLTKDELLEKELLEQAAIHQLLGELPPLTGQLVSRYELQDESEARFVKAVDKLLPLVVDVIGDGLRVMHEDYGLLTIDELEIAHANLHARIQEKFGEEFPEIILAHQILSELFEQHFAEQDSP